MSGTEIHILTSAQKQKLNSVLRDTYFLDPLLPHNNRVSFPQLSLKPFEVFLELKRRLVSAGICVQDISLVGGAACYVLSERQKVKQYNDLDIVITVDFDKSEHVEKFNTIRIELLRLVRRQWCDDWAETQGIEPGEQHEAKVSIQDISKIYISKMIKVPRGPYMQSDDFLSLICFRDNLHPNLEFKFVHSMKRPYEFSSHSFAIILTEKFLNSLRKKENLPQFELQENETSTLDGTEVRENESPSGTSSASLSMEEPVRLIKEFLNYNDEATTTVLGDDGPSTDDASEGSAHSRQSSEDHGENSRQSSENQSEGRSLTESADLRPTEEVDIQVKTYYHSWEEAIHNLNEELVDVYKPEEVRGGGFLKYCHLKFLGWELRFPKELSRSGKDISEKRRKFLQKQENLLAASFLVNFRTQEQQYSAFRSYLLTHFMNQRTKASDYLKFFQQIIPGNKGIAEPNRLQNVIGLLYAQMLASNNEYINHNQYFTNNMMFQPVFHPYYAFPQNSQFPFAQSAYPQHQPKYSYKSNKSNHHKSQKKGKKKDQDREKDFSNSTQQTYTLQATKSELYPVNPQYNQVSYSPVNGMQTNYSPRQSSRHTHSSKNQRYQPSGKRKYPKSKLIKAPTVKTKSKKETRI